MRPRAMPGNDVVLSHTPLTQSHAKAKQALFLQEDIL
jgi:hypothetical protein